MKLGLLGLQSTVAKSESGSELAESSDEESSDEAWPSWSKARGTTSTGAAAAVTKSLSRTRSAAEVIKDDRVESEQERLQRLRWEGGQEVQAESSSWQFGSLFDRQQTASCFCGSGHDRGPS